MFADIQYTVYTREEQSNVVLHFDWTLNYF